MAKKACFIVMLILLSGGLFAQVGFKGGLNLAKLSLASGGATVTSSELTSFHAGIYGVSKKEKFGFQFELLYSGKGSGDTGAAFRLNYLSVPIMMRYDITPNLNLQFGPQVEYLLSGTINGQDATNGLSEVEFALGFGLGAELQSGMSLGFRYVLGLTNTLINSPGVSMTNQVIQFSIGYRKPRNEQK